MILLIGLALVLQVPAQTQPSRVGMVIDSIEREMTRRATQRATERARRASEAGRKEREVRAVTPQHLATAFKDVRARSMLERARQARLSLDSALLSYDATTYQRISAKLAFTKLGRERLVFRTEHAGRVQWQRGVGVWVTVTGARTAMPGVPSIGQREAAKGLTQASVDMVPIPYFPGSDALWAGVEVARPNVADEGPVHPLAAGAEAYYTYASGDSLSIRLPDGKTVKLHELLVRPRESSWRLMVGALWFDQATAQLVRAAYRFSVPMHIDEFVLDEDPTAFDDVPAWIKPLMMPMRGEVSAVTIEYGLYEGRFWLPRVRTLNGVGQASFMRAPFELQQSFKYASVNGRDSLPKVPLATVLRAPDSLTGAARTAWRDSVLAAQMAAARARRDSARAGLLSARRVTQCDTSEYRVTATRRFDDARVPVATRIPCDQGSLQASATLPASIYDPAEELFDAGAREALIKEALSMGAQPPLDISISTLLKPRIAAGLQQMRYNRIEGFSPGITANEILGAGYTLDALGRIGTADRSPNFELTLTRTNLSDAFYLSAYKSLVAVGDWGNPLSFGSSLSGVLFGRDEGFYYRATGVSLGGRREPGSSFEWRVFMERQRTADVRTTFSVGGANDLPNIAATTGTFTGVATRLRHQHGLDPRGFRIFSDLRAEAAMSDSAYGRGALDLTFAKGIGEAAAALTLSGGSSLGALPTQRRWYLGGAQTVRGQQPDTAIAGSAFWNARAEVGRTIQGARPSLFADLGWVGDRAKWRDVGRPLSGVGAGLSLLDGLMRFDVSRGVYARRQWRVDSYIEAVF